MAQDYSQKDAASVYEELLDIVEASTTAWHPKYSTEADPGVVLLKLMALLEDKANYRFDMSQSQAYLDTVSDRQSAFDLLKMLGYLMKQARAATGEITLLKIPSGWSAGVTAGHAVFVPKFTAITDMTKTLKFFTTRDITVRYSKDDQDGKYEVETVVPVQAGEPFQITKDGASYFTLKDIDEQGRLYLGKTGLAQNGIFLRTMIEIDGKREYVDDWTYLDFAILKPTGKWYTVQTSETNEIYIQFPENFEFLVGSTMFEVYATYTTGSASNISANQLTLFENDDYKPYFSIRQSSAFSNGQDAESIKTASENYYATKDICNTLVTAADYVAAIRYLLCSIPAENSKYTPGNRYFSNVIVRTANDRKTRVRTTCFGTDYTLYVPDDTEASNQIDVVALQASDKYSESFKRITGDMEIARIENDLSEQLIGKSSTDVKIKIDKDTYPRILAVTTPDMYVRISDYSVANANALRAKIANYFRSNYSASMVTPGKPLNYQTIIDDITKLSPNILSVSMKELEYKMYENYSEVDGATSETAERNLETVARAALAGDIPLFKFYNRQNTITKSIASYYSTSLTNEKVTTVPLGSTKYERLTEISANPKVTAITVLKPGTNDTVKVAINSTTVLQFRSPSYAQSAVYGFGLRYAFSTSSCGEIGEDVSLNVGDILKAGTILAPGSILWYDTTKYTVANITSGASVPAGNYVRLNAAVTLSKASVARKGSTLASGSTIKGQENVKSIPADTPYKLEDYDVVIIRDSNGTQKARFEAGSVIQPNFSMNTTTTDEILQATNQIAECVQEGATISTDYVYLLSLQSTDKTINVKGGYMLEENEFLIYADRSLTEYVTLGPGTVLYSEKSCSLVITQGVDLNAVLAEQFHRVVTPITAKSYKLTTFNDKNSKVFELNGFDTMPTGWTSNGEDTETGDTKSYIIKVYDVANVDDITPATPIYTYDANSKGQFRFLLSLVSDENGVVELPRPASISLNGSEITGKDAASSVYLISSIPFSGVFSGETYTKTLLPAGSAGVFSTALPSFNEVITNVTPLYDTTYLELTAQNDIQSVAELPIAQVTSKLIALRISYPYIPENASFSLTVSGVRSDGVANAKLLNLSQFTGALSKDTEFSDSIDIQVVGESAPENNRYGSTILVKFMSGNTEDGNLSIRATSALIPAGTKIRIDYLSYITDYADETGLSGGAEFDYSLINKIIELDTEKRFNWLCMPTEKYSYPLKPESYFNPAHPLNSYVLPYVHVDESAIKVISGR